MPSSSVASSILSSSSDEFEGSSARTTVPVKTDLRALQQARRDIATACGREGYTFTPLTEADILAAGSQRLMERSEAIQYGLRMVGTILDSVTDVFQAAEENSPNVDFTDLKAAMSLWETQYESNLCRWFRSLTAAGADEDPGKLKTQHALASGLLTALNAGKYKDGRIQAGVLIDEQNSLYQSKLERHEERLDTNPGSEDDRRKYDIYCRVERAGINASKAVTDESYDGGMEALIQGAE